jgi:ferrous iron transport protein B
MNKILVVGKPNSGKSLLFNRLTGLNQRVSNFPGVTVELKSGHFQGNEVIDFPGIYSLDPLSKDEQIAIQKLKEEVRQRNTQFIICVLDATRLERSLIIGLEAQRLASQYQKAFIFALNMMDELERHQKEIDIKNLEKTLGSPVYPVSARTMKGFESFQKALSTAQRSPSLFIPICNLHEIKSMPQCARKIAKTFVAESDILLKKQNQVDQFLLNHTAGGVFFLGIMFLLFQSIFTWAAPLMDIIENSFGLLSQSVGRILGEGVFSDFIQHAFFGGIGSFLVFVPQIMILTFIIGLLEDSGYLARAALICHRPLSFFGLSGKSFIPYLTGHACAIPAIMSARTIESPRKRLLTMMTIPLMSCSARLPVYALLVAVLIPPKNYLGGLLNLQGMVFFALYLIGIFTALFVAFLLTSLQRKPHVGMDHPFILELPPYRIPHWKPLAIRVLDSAKKFVTKAGPIILIVTAVVWCLGYFPNQGANLELSFLANIGRAIEPLFEPLGLDWRYGVAILASFLAREVFVGTLGTLFGIAGADENISALSENIQVDGLAFGAGAGLLLFYVIALQCVSTIAILKAETGSRRIAWGLFISYGALAYFVAFSVKAML